MADDELVQQVIPAGLLEDRQVAKVVLQPPSLRLERKDFEIHLLQKWTSSETFRLRDDDDDVRVTWAVASMTAHRDVRIQLVPQSHIISQARASSSTMWPRWRQKNRGRARNRPSLSACARKEWKSRMIAAWEQRRDSEWDGEMVQCCDICQILGVQEKLRFL